MKICENLRQSVLQAAIQGKLVEQRPEEGTGEELYQQIQAEKQKLIKAGKFKKEKPLSEITEDEIPFEIPDSWKWVKLGNICSICTGKKDANFGSSIGNYFFFTCAKEPIRCNSFSFSGESILMAGNGDIGNISYYFGEFEAYQRTYVLQPYMEFTYLKYVLYHLSYNWVPYNNDKMFGTAIPYIKLGNVQNYLVALPSLAEQKRIVAKIDELMAKIDDLEKTENELEMLKKDFPEDMKASILQAAMQGKLTKQLPSDGDASELIYTIKNEKEALVNAKKIKKEKPLSPINEDDTPFDIPENWKWIRFGEILTVISGTSYDKTEIRKNGLRIIRGGNLQDNRLVAEDTDVFLDEEKYGDKQKQVKKNDIVVVASTGSLTAIGRPAFADDNPKACMQIGAFLRIIRPINDLLYPYIKIVFLSSYYRNWISASVSGIGIRNLKEQHITNLIVPLPPLAEQIRIVDKVNQLLPLCEILQEGVE